MDYRVFLVLLVNMVIKVLLDPWVQLVLGALLVLLAQLEKMVTMDNPVQLALLAFVALRVTKVLLVLLALLVLLVLLAPLVSAGTLLLSMMEKELDLALDQWV